MSRRADSHHLSDTSGQRQGDRVRGQGCAIGVDLGGQSVRLAVVDDDGAISLRRQADVDAAEPGPHIIQLVITEIRGLLKDAGHEGFAPSAVGVVMPGYMDRDRTRLLYAANLPTLSGSDLLSRVKDAIELPVVFDADCNAAAFGEYRFGAGRGVDRLIVATIGTGVGAGVVIDGRILRVRNHVAGSLGHVIVDPKGPKCPCGARGCVEAFASGRAIERRASDLARAGPDSRLAAFLADRGQITGLEIAQALADGDEVAQRAVRDCGWWLGVGVASWSAVYAPNRVLIGGGMASLGEPLLAAVREGFQEVGQPDLTNRVTIERAGLGSEAGVIGAAAMAADPSKDHRV